MVSLKVIGFRKLYAGIVILIAFLMFSLVYSSYVIFQNENIIEKNHSVTLPYLEKLDRLDLIINLSKMYSTNWVYLERSVADKEALVKLHKIDYPHIKQEIQNHYKHIEKADIDTLNLIFKEFEALLEIEKTEIMDVLVTFDDYQVSTNVFSCEEVIDTEVLPRTDHIQKIINRLMSINLKRSDKMQEEMMYSLKVILVVVPFFGIGILIAGLIAAIYIHTAITQPIVKVKNNLLLLSKGKNINKLDSHYEDVIADMIQALNSMSEAASQTTLFASEIGDGNLKADYTPLSEDDKLGKALIEMRNSLRAYSEEMEAKVEIRTKELNESNHKLEAVYADVYQKNRHITNSIQYAKRIQEATLPSMKTITDLFPKSFIFFRPRDIVSGDFYWVAEYKNPALQIHKVAIAVVDCTGHGVPGAFMSLVGNAYLNQILFLKQITKAGTILDELNTNIRLFLKQDENENRDGMDMTIAVIDKNTNIMEFAGARNQMIYFHQNELILLKGNKNPIGGHRMEEEDSFDTHTITLQEDMTFYMFSDGFKDQFGGNYDKKFLMSNFKTLLQDMHHSDMSSQKIIIEKAFDNWKGTSPQIDDVLVMGFKVPV